MSPSSARSVQRGHACSISVPEPAASAAHSSWPATTTSALTFHSACCASSRDDPANQCHARLVQADGGRLPFRDATFDAVLLVQVIGAAQSWRTLVTEAQRTLQPAGALILGHAVAPAAGIDAQMKQRLASLLGELGVSYDMETRGVAQPWLEARARTSTRVTAAEWTAERTPEGFLSRQQTGARFSRLPEAVRAATLRKLTEWAGATFGSLDTAFRERHAFELQLFKF